MDARLQTIPDPDRRMAVNLGTRENPQYESRISKLTPSEIGFIDVKSLTQNGHQVSYRVEGTILEVTLASPIQPGDKATFDMVFEGQVPVQIRRSGRDSRDGIALSMSQWYPKMAEYDFEGWHIDPYIAREFHGVWGNFDVKIPLIRITYWEILDTFKMEMKSDMDIRTKVLRSKNTKEKHSLGILLLLKFMILHGPPTLIIFTTLWKQKVV